VQTVKASFSTEWHGSASVGYRKCAYGTPHVLKLWATWRWVASFTIPNLAKRVSTISFIKGSVSPRAILEVTWRGKSQCPYRERNPGRPARWQFDRFTTRANTKTAYAWLPYQMSAYHLYCVNLWSTLTLNPIIIIWSNFGSSPYYLHDFYSLGVQSKSLLSNTGKVKLSL
jgi:hypothetical protein